MKLSLGRLLLLFVLFLMSCVYKQLRLCVLYIFLKHTAVASIIQLPALSVSYLSATPIIVFFFLLSFSSAVFITSDYRHGFDVDVKR